jgi:hypothetical protein
VRIAAGVSVWGKVEVTLYLRAAAVEMLSQETDEMVDEESFRNYLPILGESGRPIYVEKGAAEMLKLGQSAMAFQEVNDGELAEMAAKFNSVIRF